MARQTKAFDPSSSSSSSYPPPPSYKPNINPFSTSHNQAECTVIYLYAITSFLFIITLQSLATTMPPVPPPSPSVQPKTSFTVPLTFFPLKDPSVPPYRDPNRTWFMSTVTGRAMHGFPEHFVFPSRPPHNNILCIDVQNKSYALGSPENAFPSNAAVIHGLTFVADSFYDYENPWHGLNAVSPFFAWMREKPHHQGCARPARLVLFKNGQLVKKVGSWVHGVLKATLGEKVVVDGLEGYKNGGVVCFERAVLMRRGLGGMEAKKRHQVFEMVRCKAWNYCGVEEDHFKERSEEIETKKMVRLTLVGRRGKRGFKNESKVMEVMERECAKVRNGAGCMMRLLHFDNMSFCNQVRAMSTTDILATTHGAQLTNMVFMPKGSSVMEMFPTGWLEGAGVGQYIYQWFASWSEMHYEGAWRDPEGFRCSAPDCFLKQKDQAVGVDEKYLSAWTAQVIARNMRRKMELNNSEEPMP